MKREMFRAVRAIVLMGVVCVATLLFCERVLNRYRLRDFDNTPQWMYGNCPLIAHACGGIRIEDENGEKKVMTYTNSREALELSLKNGYHLIEVDLMMTTDGDFACTHSWPGEDKTPMSSAQWKEYKVDGMYTSQTLRDVLRTIKDYENIYLVLDIKSNHKAKNTQKEFTLLCEQAAEVAGGDGADLLDRIIPQIYTMDMYEQIKAIYPWKSIIYTLYKQKDVSDEEIVEFVRDKDDIPIVTIPSKRAKTTDIVEKLHAVGKYAYSHTFNNTLALRKYLNMGIDGFYTDSILPKNFRLLYGNGGPFPQGLY